MEKVESYNPGLFKDTEEFLAQLDRENQELDKQIQSLCNPPDEEEVIKEYDLAQPEQPQEFSSCKSSFQSLKKSSQTDELYRNQISYLETRLQSANQAIVNLETQLKHKDKRIKELEEQPSKDPSKDPFKEPSKEHPVAQTAFSASLKRKEREQEKKMQELEKKLAEERKAMLRLQNLNKDLLSKVKDTQKKEVLWKTQLNKKQLKEAQTSSLFEENQQLSLLCQQLQAQLEESQQSYEELKTKYQNLLDSSLAFEEKTRELYKINQHLTSNLSKIFNNQD